MSVRSRRRFLGSVTSSFGVVVAGCVGNSPPGASAETGVLIESTETTTSIQKTADGVSAEFSLTDVGPPADHDPKETATIAFGSTSDRVTITGTTILDGCHDIRFRSVTRSTERNELTVVVGAERTERGTVACGAAAYNYRIVLAFDSKFPETITIVHQVDGERTLATSEGRT